MATSLPQWLNQWCAGDRAYCLWEPTTSISSHPSLSSTLIVAWNQPWWDYLHDSNRAMGKHYKWGFSGVSWVFLVFCFVLVFFFQRAGVPAHHGWKYWQLKFLVESGRIPFLHPRQVYVESSKAPASEQQFRTTLKSQSSLCHDGITVWLLPILIPASFTPSQVDPESTP